MIEVLQGGTLTTVQDAGRDGHRNLGIPASGAADRLNFALANWLIGNDWAAPVLECTLGGLHLKFKQDANIALTGAEMWAQVNGQNVSNFSAFPVKAGDILTMSFARIGCRAYIAVSGGFEADIFLGSRSTYTLARVGGVKGRALKAGDVLQFRGGPDVRRHVPFGFKPRLSNHAVLRTRPGPEFSSLALKSQRHLFVTPFVTSTQTDRMGSRLRGDRIQTDGMTYMTSGPMLPGTVQLPPDGQLILALVDGHCTGGYPRILQVIKADHWIMGQIGPSMHVSFKRCFDGEAPVILRRRIAMYGNLIPNFSF